MITALQMKKKNYWALCESRCIRNINLQYWCQLFAMERNGLYGNAALILTKFSLLKSIFEVNLHQINSLVFRPTASLSLCNLWGKEQLVVKLPDDFSAQNHWASWYSRFFRQKLAYSNESLKHKPRGTFAELSVKEWNVMATKTNTITPL